MTRILKVYDFRLKGSRVASNVISFPSYPGSLSSLDDFYLMERYKFVLFCFVLRVFFHNKFRNGGDTAFTLLSSLVVWL
jgi:hypothetical protein